MQMRNKVHFDFKDNPKLRDTFSGKQVGDRCTLEVELQVDELTEEGLVGTVKSITPEGYEPHSADDEEEISPASDEPVLMVIGGKSGVNLRAKKKKAGGGY